MFGWVFDPATNGILLIESDKSNANGSSIRPVFFEELDSLGFDKVFEYPKSKHPILWTANRIYYYRGEPVAKVFGGSLTSETRVEFIKSELTFKPTNVKKMLEKNNEKLSFSTFDAIDFIIETYETYKSSIDLATVSFSGGKDSTVVLDLVKRALGPDKFVAIFSDTGMEIPLTYETVSRVDQENPDLRFLKAGIDEPAIEMWRKIGPPSRVNRWCCPVLKTAPYIKMIRQFTGKADPTILTYEGVRAEESEKRAKYGYIGTSHTISKQINARPILEWSQAEIFLYILSRNLTLNPSYRLGFSRVGCSICPYGSSWSEHLLKTHFAGTISPYVQLIKETAQSSGVADFDRYMEEGGWKIRTGGYYLPSGTNVIDFVDSEDDVRIDIIDPKENIWEWLGTLGPVVKDRSGGTFAYNGKLIRVEIAQFPDGVRFTIRGINDNIELKNLIRRIGYKVAYCIHCGACEGACPTGALRCRDKITVNEKICTRCHSCIDHSQKGCLVAKSLHPKDVDKMGQKTIKGVDRYKTFGMRREWVKTFLLKGDGWALDSGMGNKQIDSMKSWLRDSGLWNKKITELGKAVTSIGDSDDLFLWSIIWTNLASESDLIYWYVSEILNGPHEKNELVNLLSQYRGECEPNRTDLNAINSLLNLFDNSPIGEELNQGKISTEEKKKYVIKGEASKVPDYAVLYGLYKYSDTIGRRSFVLGEVMRDRVVNNEKSQPVFSPAHLFSLTRQDLQRRIIRLSEANRDLIVADFSGNLDNIHLNSEKGPLDVVEAYVKTKRVGSR